MCTCELLNISIWLPFFFVNVSFSSLPQNERDVSVRQRAVDLLYAMCDHSNAVTIVTELLEYLKSKADYSIREELVGEGQWAWWGRGSGCSRGGAVGVAREGQWAWWGRGSGCGKGGCSRASSRRWEQLEWRMPNRCYKPHAVFITAQSIIFIHCCIHHSIPSITSSFTFPSQVLKIAILAEIFAPDSSWYVDTMLNLVRWAGDYVSEEVWHRVIQVIINRDDVRGYAAKTCFEVRAHCVVGWEVVRQAFCA